MFSNPTIYTVLNLDEGQLLIELIVVHFICSMIFFIPHYKICTHHMFKKQLYVWVVICSGSHTSKWVTCLSWYKLIFNTWFWDMFSLLFKINYSRISIQLLSTLTCLSNYRTAIREKSFLYSCHIFTFKIKSA